MYLLGLLYIPTWLAWILAVILMFVGYTLYKQSFFRRLGIIGPPPTPYLGHLGIMSKIGLFYMDRKFMDEYGKVVGTYYGNVPALVISDADMIREICVQQFSKFYNRAEPIKISERWKRSLNNARDAKWKFLRTVIQPTFSSGKIRAMRPIFNRCLDDFRTVLDQKMDECDDGVINMYPLFTALTMDVICSVAFGIEVNSQKNPDDVFVKHASKILGSGFKNPLIILNCLFPDFRDLIMLFGKDYIDTEAMDFLERAVLMVIKERHENKADYNDLVKLMLDTQKGKTEDDRKCTTFEEYKEIGMTNDDIIMNGLIFLAAGYDTTSTLLAWLSFCLATNPKCQEKLVEEINRCVGTDKKSSYDQIMKMEYLDMFVSETLRLYSPATRFNREASCDVTIKGLKIPKGMHVTFCTQAMHRNPEYWPDPDVFDPERFSPENKGKIVPYSWIPFGIGPKNCVGMKLAIAEVKMAIVDILQYVRLSPSPKLIIPPNIDKGIVTKPLDGTWLKVERRSATL